MSALHDDPAFDNQALRSSLPGAGATCGCHHGLRESADRRNAVFDKSLAHVLENLHAFLAFGLAAIAGLHVAAALEHQFVKRDAVPSRMWPAGRARPNAKAARATDKSLAIGKPRGT